MSQMQTKILNILRAKIEGAGFEYISSPLHANTGTVYVQQGLHTALSFYYDFQATYAAILFSDNTGKAIKNCRFRFNDERLINDMMSYVDSKLPAPLPPKKSTPQPLSLDKIVLEFEIGSVLAALVEQAGLRHVTGALMMLCHTNAAEDIGEPEEQERYKVFGEELEKAMEATTARLHPVT